jgi:hypothetical protein
MFRGPLNISAYLLVNYYICLSAALKLYSLQILCEVCSASQIHPFNLATLLAVKAEENGRGTLYVVNVRFWSYQELLQIYIMKEF